MVHALGIEDSDTTPAEAVAELKAEIERLRRRLDKIEHAPVDPGNTVAMTLKGWAAPRDGEPENG